MSRFVGLRQPKKPKEKTEPEKNEPEKPDESEK